MVTYLVRCLQSEFTFGTAVLGPSGQYSDALRALAVPVYELGDRFGRWNPWSVRRLIEVVLHEHYDLIHTHLFKSQLVGTFAAMRTATKTILHEQWGVDSHSLKQFSFFSNAVPRNGYLSVYRYVLRHCDRVIALTPQMLQSYVDSYSVEPNRITVLPNAVDISAFEKTSQSRRGGSIHKELGLPEETRLVLMVGRLEPQKDWWTFLRVARHLEQREKYPVAFLVVGSGSQESELRQYARSHGLHNVVFLGHRTDIPMLLNQADVFLFTSRYEPFGIVVVEAMAAGCPVVAARTVGPESIMTHGSNGLLADVGDVQAMGDYTARILQDDELGKQLAQRARQTVAEHYSLEAVSTRMGGIYREVLSS
jgi:glycosyltransferase involved in cell wall biosynthesis